MCKLVDIHMTLLSIVSGEVAVVKVGALVVLAI